MGRSVIAEENLLTSLKNLSKDSGFSIGLILGQCTSQKDYIVHLAPSSPPAEDKNATPECGDICSVKELRDYDDNWIANHTRNVIKMLPGGMSILGVFLTCPNSSSDTAVFNKLRTLAIHSFNSTKNNQFLHLLKNSNRLLLQYSLNNKTYVCKSLDAGSLNASLQPVDLKFSGEPLKWYTVDSSVNLANFGSHFIPKSKDTTLKKMLKEMSVAIQLKVESCECSVDRKFVDSADELRIFKEKQEKKIKELEKLTGKKINFDSKSVVVQLYDRKLPDEFSFKVDHMDHCIEIIFRGDVTSRVFMNSFASLEDTIKAVKEDILRCCSTKFEMHWETNDVAVASSKINERSKEEMHILPRRVLITVPNSKIQFSEYLFLDESAEDVIPSIEEHLGIQVDESAILDILEAKCDTSMPTKPDENSSKKANKITEARSNNSFIIAVILVSFVVLIISVCLKLFLK